MASLRTAVSLFLLLAFPPLLLRARELTSFSKAVTSSTAVEGKQPEMVPTQTQNGYRLYGSRPEEYFTTSTKYYDGVGGRNPRTDREFNAVYPNYEESYKSKEQVDTINGDGLSDTRSVENGKYFYDVNGERHGEAYAGYGVYNYGHLEKRKRYYSQGMEGEYYNP